MHQPIDETMAGSCHEREDGKLPLLCPTATPIQHGFNFTLKTESRIWHSSRSDVLQWKPYFKTIVLLLKES